MRKFIEAANFKKATLIYLAFKMPEKDIEELRKLFISCDKNGDGKITIDEFGQALLNFGVEYSFAEIKELMNKLDANNNGVIDYTEFLAGCMKSKIYLKEEYLRSAFSFFDKVTPEFMLTILGLKRFNYY
jgi:Ca2+-binding EF-hand superfamily protein